DGGAADPGDPEGYRSRLHAAWAANFLSYLVVSTSRALFPKLGIELGMSATLIGSILLCVYLSLVTVFYAFRGLIRFPSSPFAILAGPLLLVVALTLLTLSRDVPSFVSAFLVLGVAMGISYHSSLFHSLLRPGRAALRSGVHETMLGLGSLLGPICGGVVVDHAPLFASAVSRVTGEAPRISSLKSPYLFCLIPVSVGLTALFLYLAKEGRQDKNPPRKTSNGLFV
ncbi:MAG TPA: MFS transporter, partial [Candidatus Latescibacteria bacterium]|nr:MFS transporter [Candidatus Latescibacterota bacterium]